jgi:hypothetical protein
MIRLLDLPPLETIDTPYKSDMPQLANRLASVLAQSIQDVQAHPDPDWDYDCTKIFPYTWEKIFSKIDQVYQLAGNRTGGSAKQPMKPTSDMTGSMPDLT